MKHLSITASLAFIATLAMPAQANEPFSAERHAPETAKEVQSAKDLQAPKLNNSMPAKKDAQLTPKPEVKKAPRTQKPEAKKPRKADAVSGASKRKHKKPEPK
jgi:hypothetical protein